MKKLIALTLCLALVLSFSFAVIAADPTIQLSYVAGADGADGTFTVVATNVGDQATMIAFPTVAGLNTSTPGTNIEYIDQQTTASGTTTFNFKFRSALTAGMNYTVRVGGSTVTDPLVATITPKDATSSGHIVSGTVNNARFTAATGDDFEDFEDPTYQEEFATSFNLSKVTTVRLIKFSQLHLFIKYLDGVLETDESVDVATTTVDTTNGAFSLPEIPDDNYALIIQRNGYITRMIKVDVLGGDFALPNDKSLLLGDVEGAVNLYVTTHDIGIIKFNTSVYSQPKYKSGYDFDINFQINTGDIGAAVANSSKSYRDYNEDESIDYDVLLES